MLETSPLHLTQPGLLFLSEFLWSCGIQLPKPSRLMPFSPAFFICCKSITAGYSSTNQTELLVPRDSTQERRCCIHTHIHQNTMSCLRELEGA